MTQFRNAGLLKLSKGLPTITDVAGGGADCTPEEINTRPQSIELRPR
jgi:hypothetical protein